MNKVGCNDLIAVDEIQSNKPTIARVDIVPETSSQHIGAATRQICRDGEGSRKVFSLDAGGGDFVLILLVAMATETMHLQRPLQPDAPPLIGWMINSVASSVSGVQMAKVSQSGIGQIRSVIM